MKLKLSACFIIVAVCCVFGCKEEFLLNNSLYKANLVVEGRITNEPGPYTIRLTQTSPVNHYENLPVKHCIVTVKDKSGQFEILEEIEPGVYVTDTNGIQGQVGNSYCLSVTTEDGKEYVSTYEELKRPIVIEDVKAEFMYKNTQEYPLGLPGYQFYISTEMIDDDDTYLMWKMEETYEYTADFELKDIYYRDVLDLNEQRRMAIVQSYKEKYFRCWKTNAVNYVYTGKTQGLTIPQIKNHPLHFVGTDSRRVTNRYSLIVMQYNISKNAYDYWNTIENQNDDNFLITTQPYNIVGNMHNKENPKEPVWGYFMVTSVTKKRIFVDPPAIEDFHYNKCTLVTDPDQILFILDDPVEEPPFYLIEYENSLGYAMVRFEYCIKCTSHGGKNIKPDFWIDK